MKLCVAHASPASLTTWSRAQHGSNYLHLNRGGVPRVLLTVIGQAGSTYELSVTFTFYLEYAL